MKKLMIAAAIVCAAAMSQAAEFKWSTGKLYHFQTANDLTGLVDGTTYTALSSGTSGYADKLNNATWAFEFVLSDGSSSETLTGDLETFSSHKVAQDVTSTLFALPTDPDTKKTYTWDIVITGNYTDKDGNEWVLTSDTIHGSKEYTNLSTPEIATGVATKWTVAAQSVPEPTSGLLLLLGVAGMALRRRRA